MVEIIKELNIEVSKPNIFQAVVAKQYDMNTRFIKATFVDFGQKITIPQSDTLSVIINAQRPDGEAKGFDGVINDDGTVTVPLHSWMLEQVGTVTCDISVIDMAEGDQKKLTTTSFTLIVEKAAWGGDGMTNDPQYNLLIELLETVESAGEMAEEALQKSNEANAKYDACVEATHAAEAVATEWQHEIDKTNGRLDELIAMRPIEGGNATYTYTTGDDNDNIIDEQLVYGTVTTNGLDVHVNLTFDSVPCNGVREFVWKGLPAHLVPMCAVACMDYYDKYGIVVYFDKRTIDGVDVPVMIFHNPTDKVFDLDAFPTFNVEYIYPLAKPFIPELADARVTTHRGTHDSAGAALRAVDEALEEHVRVYQDMNKAVGKRLLSVEEDVATLKENGGGAGGTALQTEEYEHKGYGHPSNDFPIDGFAGKEYVCKINSVADTSFTSCNIYLMHADGTNQVVKSEPTIGEEYTVTANEDFVSIRFWFNYAVKTENNTVSVSFGLYSQAEENYAELSAEVKALSESVATLSDDVAVIGDGFSSLQGGAFLQTERYLWGVKQPGIGNPNTRDFLVDGIAGEKYTFKINSMDNPNYKAGNVYFMRADGTNQWAQGSPVIGEQYTVTADADFTSIRFYFTYDTPPENSYISVSFGRNSYLLENYPELVDKVNGLTDDGESDVVGQPITLLHGYTENVACIGDSLTAGLVTGGGGYNTYYNYPYFLGKLMNTDTTAIAHGGYTTSQMWSEYQTDISNIANSVVVVWLGTNQGLTDTVSADCVGDDIAGYASNYTGDYGRIIKTLIDNGNKVVLAHIFIAGGTNGVPTTNAAIESLAERFNCKLISLDDADMAELNAEKYHTTEAGNYDRTHFNCMGYSRVANMFYGKMNSLALDDPQWFCIRKTK
jgi:lysophospholipase L1-like esterase